MISPLAYVDPEAKLGQNVEVGPFAYIEKGVVIGDNCVIKSHAGILKVQQWAVATLYIRML